MFGLKVLDVAISQPHHTVISIRSSQRGERESGNEDSEDLGVREKDKSRKYWDCIISKQVCHFERVGAGDNDGTDHCQNVERKRKL